MTHVPPLKEYVDIESMETRSPVGESMLQTLGASNNFMLDTIYFQADFKMNSSIKIFSGQIGVDGLWPVRSDWPNWEIIDVVMYGNEMGSGGTVELDIKQSPTNGASFSSIFSTTPKISSAAANFSSIGIGGGVSGCTSPVLTSSPNPLSIAGGTRLRLDVLNMQSGNPKNFGIWIFFRST